MSTATKYLRRLGKLVVTPSFWATIITMAVAIGVVNYTDAQQKELIEALVLVSGVVVAAVKNFVPDDPGNEKTPEVGSLAAVRLPNETLWQEVAAAMAAADSALSDGETVEALRAIRHVRQIAKKELST